MDTFLKPFVDESIHLNDIGVQWIRDGISVISKVHILTSTVDAVVRPLLRNTKHRGVAGFFWLGGPLF